MNLGLKFTPQEEQLVKQRYDLKQNGRLSWKQFADSIEKHFSANDLNRDPSTQRIEPPELYVM